MIKKISEIDLVCNYCINYINENSNQKFIIKDINTNQNKLNFIEEGLIIIGTINTGSTNNIDNLGLGIRQVLFSLNEIKQLGEISNEQYNKVQDFIFNNILDKNNAMTDKGLEYQGIPFSDMMFMIHEYSSKSKVYNMTYNFDKIDMRRTTFDRIQVSTFNTYQDYKNNKNNLQFFIMDAIINTNYTLSEIMDIIINNKEVGYRLSFINMFYFNMEHLLSYIIKEHLTKDTVKKQTKKQQLLSYIINELGLKESINLKNITENIISRCKNSSTKLKNIIKQEEVLNKNMTELFFRFINIRNSFHSNGKVNKNENSLQIGQIFFKEVFKDNQHEAMGIQHVLILSLIMMHIMETVCISINSKDIMIDDFLIHKSNKIKEFNEKHNTNFFNSY